MAARRTTKTAPKVEKFLVVDLSDYNVCSTLADAQEDFEENVASGGGNYGPYGLVKVVLEADTRGIIWKDVA